MHPSIARSAVLLALVALLTACGGNAAAPQSSSATATAPANPAPAATRAAPPATSLPAANRPPATAPAASTPAAAASESGFAAIPQSRTAEGYQVLGDPNAPVTLTYYSDFL